MNEFEKQDTYQASEVKRMKAAYERCQLTRREFMQGLMAVGLTATTATAILTGSRDVRAMTPKKGGKIKVAFTQHGPTDTLDPTLVTDSISYARGRAHQNRLVQFNDDITVRGDLAESFEVNSDATEFTFHLRKDVTFHDGNDFTADDVLISLERIRLPASNMTFVVTSIEEIVKVDDHAIDIVTKYPDPTLLLNLPNFWIMDKEWLEANDAFGLEEGATVKTFANLNVNGTGPFMLEEWVPDTRTVLAPNPNWWGTPRHNLTKVVFTPIGNAATRVAALLSGEIDLMYPVPLQDVPRLDSTPGVDALQGPELRTIFLGFDQHRDELLDMPGTGRNPFKDVRVRKAFYQAIDINAIKRVVMRNASTPTGLMIAPGINGFQEDMNDRFPYDPEAAKKLLAEAGYPDGFPLTFDCPNDRYVNDEAICLAVVPMLKRIGIDVKLNAQTKSLHFQKIGRKEQWNTSFFMLGWTPGSYDAHNPLLQLMSLDGEGQGTWNCGRYTNPRVEELTDRIAGETDVAKRNTMIREAYEIHKNEVGHIPLHQQALAWGIGSKVKDVEQRPHNDVDLRYVTMQ